MEDGDFIPAYIRNKGKNHIIIGAAGNIMYKNRKSEMLCNNPIEAILTAKYTEPYSTSIQPISLDPFFTEYWSDSQKNWYRNYCQLEYRIINLDATGGLVCSINWTAN